MTASPARPAARPFTGRKLAAIFGAFFAVVIAVNLAMAMAARGSWTGLVVANSYVASQEFNAKVAVARAQRARGWTGTLSLGANSLALALKDKTGRTLPLATVHAVFRSPTTDRSDLTVTLAPATDEARGAVALADGLWVVEIVAVTTGGIRWHDTRRIVVTNGEAR